MLKSNSKKLGLLKILIVVAVVLLQLWVMAGQVNNKTYYDIDEVSSFTLANNKDGMIWYDNYGWIHAGTFQKFGVTTQRFDLGTVWENQKNDCHPPLFYTPMHLLSSTFIGRLSPWVALLPNVLYQLITLAAIGYIIYVITKRYYAAMCGVVLFAFNPSVLTYANYVRMYSMANMWTTLFAAVVIKLFYEQDKYDDFKIKGTKYKLWICLWAVTALGGLTHYYFYIAAFFISCFIGLYWLIKKKWGILAKYCVLVPMGILTAIAIFPAVITHLTSSVHTENALKGLAGGEWAGRINSFWGFSPFGGFLTKVLVCTIIFLAIQAGTEVYKKKTTGKRISIEVGEYIGVFGVAMAILYLLSVSRIATYVQQRYIVPIETIFIISFFLIWYYSIKSILSKLQLDLRVIVGFIMLEAIVMSGGMQRTSIPRSIAPPPPSTFEEYAIAHQSEQAVLFTPEYCGYVNQNFMTLRYYGDIYLANLTEKSFEDDVEPHEFDNVTTAMVAASFVDSPKIQAWLDKFMPDAKLVLQEAVIPNPYYVYSVVR